jgi:hypothetical protein
VRALGGYLFPQILAVKSRVASFESAPDAPERVRFRALHGASMLLNLLVLADGAVLLAFARKAPGGSLRCTENGRRFPI